MKGTKRMQPQARVHDRRSTDLPINSVAAPIVVKDPAGDHIQVLRSLRDDPLAGMHARQQIDDAQLAAGRLWQRHHEASEIGSIQAIDPAKEAVDGGKMRDPITDKTSAAFAALKEAHRKLGSERAALVFDVLGRRVGIRQAAEARGLWTKHGWEQTGLEFRIGLEILAALWGLISRTQSLRLTNQSKSPPIGHSPKPRPTYAKR